MLPPTHTEPPTLCCRPTLFMGKSQRSKVTSRASDQGEMAKFRGCVLYSCSSEGGLALLSKPTEGALSLCCDWITSSISAVFLLCKTLGAGLFGNKPPPEKDIWKIKSDASPVVANTCEHSVLYSDIEIVQGTCRPNTAHLKRAVCR